MSPGYNRTVNSVRFSPTDSQLIISASGHTVQQWDVDGRQIGLAYEGDDVAFSSDETRFILWREGVAMVRDSDSGAFVTALRPPGRRLECCRFSPDGKTHGWCCFQNDLCMGHHRIVSLPRRDFCWTHQIHPLPRIFHLPYLVIYQQINQVLAGLCFVSGPSSSGKLTLDDSRSRARIVAVSITRSYSRG
jgi:WD40 repeat protein